MNVLIANRQRSRKLDLRLLKKIVRELLAELEMADAEIEVNLVGAPEMAALNETFLQHPGSTDVITFDYSEPETGKKGPERRLLGEIFVSVDDAVAQSKQFKASWQSEVVRYIVHGVLHLLGHDDLRAAGRRRMKREENRLVGALSRRFSLAKVSRAS